MSRNISTGSTTSSSGRKLQISSPQPYHPPARQFDGTGTGGPLPPALQPVQVPPGMNLRRPGGNASASGNGNASIGAEGGGLSPSISRGGATNGSGNGGSGGGRFEPTIPPPGIAIDGTSGDLSSGAGAGGAGRRIPSNASGSSVVSASAAASTIPGTSGTPLRPARSIRRAPGAPGGGGSRQEAQQRSVNRIPTPPSLQPSGPSSSSSSSTHPQFQPGQHVQPPPPHPSNTTYSHSAPTDQQQHQLVSPITDEPPTPIGTHQPTSGSGRVWEQDRAQRSQMVRDVVGRGKEREVKLRGVVDAFSGAGAGRGTGGSGEGSRVGSGTATPRDRGREGNYQSMTEVLQDQDLLIGQGGRGFDDVDAVLRKIRRDWPEVLGPDFSPTTLALSLLSTQTTTSTTSTQSTNQPTPPPPPTDDRLSQFLQAHQTLSSSLSQTVKTHYQVYANSLPAHADLMSALGRIQAVVRETKEGLKRGKELLAGGAAGMDARGRVQAAGAGGGGGAAGGVGGAGGVGKRGEMAVLWNKERMLRDSLKLLDTIENMNKVPERLESLIGEKKFLQASLILTRSLKTIDREDVLEIEALGELRTYLQAQMNALMEILIEELSNHLYLKTVYSESRWVVYQPGQAEMIVPKYNAEEDLFSLLSPSLEPALPTPTNPGDRMSSRLSRFLVNLSMKPLRDPILYLSDAELLELPAIPQHIHRRGPGGLSASVSSMSGFLAGGNDQQGGAGGKFGHLNPEQDSFAYMEVILESLSILGKLGHALEVISARIGSDLFTLVESTIDEVAERMDMRQADLQSMRLQTIIEGSNRISTSPSSSTSTPNTLQRIGKPARLRNEVLDQTDSAEQAETLLDLFWTVYSKLRAVVEGHRVVGEIVGRIGMRPGQSQVKQAIAIPMEEVIKPMQKEVRTLMHDYLTDQDRGSDANIKPLTTINDVLRNSKSARDRHKVVFRFGDTDSQALEKDLRTYQDTVDGAMKTYAPGLVTLAEKGIQNGVTVTTINLDLTSRKARQHRLLVKPNPFNARLLFQPYLSFVSSAKQVAGISSLDDEAEVIGSFMDDFVVKVYLPQLEDKVTSVFQDALNSPSAFLVDVYWNAWSVHPIVKSATDVMGFVNSLCFMLSHTPFQRENYSRLIIGIIVRYYQRCSTHYRDLVTSDSYTAGDLPLAAIWAQREEIVACLEELQATPMTNKSRQQELVRQETRIELDLHSGKSVTEKDLIGGRAKFEALAQLYYSIRWLVSQLNKLKIVANDGTSPLVVQTSKRLSLIPTPTTSTTPQLELSTAMAQRFDAILSTYDQLGDLVLFTLRAELRCRTMHYCEVSMSKGNYRIENEADEPDPYILDLTVDLGECYGAVLGKLPEEDVRFLFCGLGALTDQVMVSSARNVRFATQFGVHKIERNILAIQQTLRNITDGAENTNMDRAKRYWALYGVGPKAMLEELQSRKPEFSFDEYNHMLNLQCKVDPKASNRFSGSFQMDSSGLSSSRSAVDADRTLYNDFLIDLHSLAINDWD